MGRLVDTHKGNSWLQRFLVCYSFAIFGFLSTTPSVILLCALAAGVFGAGVPVAGKLRLWLI
jgi:hypothetical protein